MKTFKQFIEDYSVGGGLTPKQMLGPGTQWFRTPAEKMKENQRFIRVAPGFIPNWLQAKKPKKFGKDSKVNPKALERPEIRDQIFTGKANLDKTA